MAEKEVVTDDANQVSLQEEYLKNLDDLEEGQIIEGTIIEINSEFVFIDVGYKSEGKIPLEEFKETPEIGSTVDVVLLKKEGKGGQVVVSKRRADLKQFWKDLKVAQQEGKPVEGTFAKTNKGGYEVDLGYGVMAFNPMSQADVTRVENQEELLGVTSKFLIERMNLNTRPPKIVISRRDWLEKQIEENREQFFSATQIGDTVKGSVKSFTSFGAFVDLGGFDGLLHINDMSWGHVTRPKDYVRKGEEIELKVIKLDPEEKKINLSLKHFTPDPWSTFETKYHVDDVVKGKVTKLTDFGAFIEIEEGIEGLAHISELSWVKRINHPKEVLSIGDEVDVKILNYDIQQGRISLGLKQVYPNPWESIEEQYPVGAVLERPVRKITNSGAFIELEEGIDGFLHVEDMSWTKKIRHPSQVVKEDETVEVMVVGVDPESHRINLGMKQLTDDPWKALAKSFSRGSVIEGEVTSVTDFGVFVRVPNGIEGLIPKHHLASPGEEYSDDLLNKFAPGQKVKTAVTDVNVKNQRLSLSIREYYNSLQREELSKYIHDDDEDAGFTLGDLLKDKGSEDDEQ